VKGERWERDTIVRALSWRRWRWVPLAIAGAAATLLWIKPLGGLAGFPVFLLVARAFMPDERRARLVADRDGLRIDGKLFPRRAIAKALLRHEGPRTFVALDGRRRVDVEVPSNVEADALVRALGLDSESSVMEFALTDPLSGITVASLLALLVAAVAVAPHLGSVLGAILFLALAILVGAAAAWLATRVVLRVGADGLVMRRPLRRDVFVPHSSLANVRADDDAVILEPPKGRPLTLQVPDRGTNSDNAEKLARRADEAAAIARRILQARRAFREHASDEGAVAAVLDRGDRSAREWLGELRRLGEGAAGTFRTIGLARAQLFEVVESTTASARDRIAAAIALRTRIADDEKPRIRVAAERCAEPELRERMLRVLEIEDDEDLEVLVDEMRSR